MNSPEIDLSKLQEPFHLRDIEFRLGSTIMANKRQGLALPYVTNRAIEDRLDDVCGLHGWRNKFREWRQKSMLCGIGIRVNGEWIFKYDGADETNWESTKGGFSGSMKRAAVQWGIGRYLYKIKPVWVKVKPIRTAKGKESWKIVDISEPYNQLAKSYPGPTDGFKPPKVQAELEEEGLPGTDVETINETQEKELVELIRDNEPLYIKLCTAYVIESLNQLSVVQFVKCKERIAKYWEGKARQGGAK